jgi:hypothetical protein
LVRMPAAMSQFPSSLPYESVLAKVTSRKRHAPGASRQLRK